MREGGLIAVLVRMVGLSSPDSALFSLNSAGFCLLCGANLRRRSGDSGK